RARRPGPTRRRRPGPPPERARPPRSRARPPRRPAPARTRPVPRACPTGGPRRRRRAAGSKRGAPPPPPPTAPAPPRPATPVRGCPRAARAPATAVRAGLPRRECQAHRVDLLIEIELVVEDHENKQTTEVLALTSIGRLGNREDFGL